MSLVKRIGLGIGGAFVLVIVAAFICNVWGISSKKSTISFSALIEQGKINELTLTIYCMNPLVLTRYPLSVGDLVDNRHVRKFVIEGSILAEHVESFRQMSHAELIPVENKSCINARLYYLFKTENGEKIFSVAMWGDDSSIFINGREFCENDIFYEAVEPFLREFIEQEWEKYYNSR